MRPLDAADLIHLAQARDAHAAVIVLIAGDGNVGSVAQVQVLGVGQCGSVYTALGDRLVADIRALLANYGTLVSDSRVTGTLDA